MLYGIEHPLSKFSNEEEVTEIKRLLKETTLSLSEIAKINGNIPNVEDAEESALIQVGVQL